MPGFVAVTSKMSVHICAIVIMCDFSRHVTVVNCFPDSLRLLLERLNKEVLYRPRCLAKLVPFCLVSTLR